MKTAVAIMVVLSIGLLAAWAYANPFVICDPQATVTFYKLTGPAWVPATVQAQPDGSIKWDVSNAPVGTSTITAAACKTDALWGEQCSVYSPPFAFTRPGVAVVPAGLKLAP